MMKCCGFAFQHWQTHNDTPDPELLVSKGDEDSPPKILHCGRTSTAWVYARHHGRPNKNCLPFQFHRHNKVQAYPSTKTKGTQATRSSFGCSPSTVQACAGCLS